MNEFDWKEDLRKGTHGPGGSAIMGVFWLVCIVISSCITIYRCVAS